MTRTLGTNDNNDIYLGSDGNIVLLSGVEAIAGACVTACFAQLGECVLETGIGLPNFQTVWVGTPDLAIWQSYLQNTLQNIDGVISVESVKLNFINNALTFTARINTVFGSTIING